MPHSTVTCRGGNAYGSKSYVIRVVDGLTVLPGADTEALLVKRGDVTNLTDIIIYTRNGTTHSTVRDYLLENSVMTQDSFAPESNGFNSIEVCIDTTWMNGGAFFTNTQPSTEVADPMPSEDEDQEPVEIAPRGGISYAMATYSIRSTTHKAHNDTSCPLEATMTISGTEQVRVKDTFWNGDNEFSSLEEWHLHHMADDNDSVQHSPRSYIDVMVDNEWIPATTFFSLRHPPSTGDDSRPPRSDAEFELESRLLIEDGNFDDTLPKPVDRSMTDFFGMDKKYRIRYNPRTEGPRVPGTWAGNGSIRCVAGFQNSLTKNTYYDYEIVLDHHAYSPDNDYVQYLDSVEYYVEIAQRTKEPMIYQHAWCHIDVEIDGTWVNGTVAALELFNITLIRNPDGRIVEFPGKYSGY